MSPLGSAFDVGEKLGQGGFGSVFRGTRVADGHPVAIKMLTAPTPETRQRFAREVRLLRQYEHPGIVKVLHADLESDPPYYVMPYYSRGTLRKYVGRLSMPETLQVVEFLIQTLVFLEERNAFHRDIKPDNVLMDDVNRPILCDFGLSSDPALTANFTLNAAGTPGYLAPELGRWRDSMSHKSDIYSLGATAFHLMTGIHPGTAMTLDPAKHLAGVPEDLRRFVLAMVDSDPRKRPGARQLLTWLKSYRRPSKSEGFPWGDLVMCVAVAAVVIGFGYLLYAWLSDDAAEEPASK